MIKKMPSGWLVDVQPGGRGGKRYRKTFKAKADAIQWEKRMLAQLVKAPDVPSKDSKRLSDLVKLWYDLHGVNLKAKNTYSRLQALVKAMGDPLSSEFSSADFASYRASRIARGVSPSTLNRERSYLVAVFSELSRLGHWQGDNPLVKLRPVRVDVPELSFLTHEQIGVLLGSLRQSSNPDVFLVAKLSLSTGARWSEAQGIALKDVHRGLVTFHRTKGGKPRSVPIEDGFAGELIERLSRGRFVSCYSAFRMALNRAGIKLPAGQCAHVLRHTFASHFVQKGGDILTLQKILGHSSVNVTMRYAHLAPAFLEQAKTLNPLAALTVG